MELLQLHHITQRRHSHKTYSAGVLICAQVRADGPKKVEFLGSPLWEGLILLTGLCLQD
jgi:hypothetical protein